MTGRSRVARRETGHVSTFLPQQKYRTHGHYNTNKRSAVQLLALLRIRVVPGSNCGSEAGFCLIYMTLLTVGT
jgi:hypothetical protein